MQQVAGCCPQGYGQYDLWDFYDLDYGRRLPCGNIGTFLHYLTSPGTRTVDLGASSVTSGTATLYLTGPRADDGRPLTVRYRPTRAEVQEVLEEWEHHLLLDAVKKHYPTSREPLHSTPKVITRVLGLTRGS
jgi:hypothetical protein